MLIFVKLLNGPTMTLDMSSTSTVLDVAHVMCCGLWRGPLKFAGTDIPPIEQRFIFAGRSLEFDKTLAYYHVMEESTLHLVLRMGSCPNENRGYIVKDWVMLGYNTMHITPRMGYTGDRCWFGPTGKDMKE